MLKNLDLLNDRDLLLDLANAKAQRLETQAKLYRKNAKKAKTNFKKRRCVLCGVSLVGVLIILAAIFLILTLWFKIL